jgi:hypothetical protein
MKIISFSSHTIQTNHVYSITSTDIGLAEELERAVAGASVEARLHALKKLRARVKEQAEPDAPDWNLSQSTQVFCFSAIWVSLAFVPLQIPDFFLKLCI